MHGTTAAVILKYLAREGLLQTRMTTFFVPRHPQPVDVRDVKDAFVALGDVMGVDKDKMKFSFNVGVEVLVSGKVFERIFRAIFVSEKLFPVSRTENVEGVMAPLPSLFVGSEKTQIRQIPLVETPPWPFRFLLELGGMIVCRPRDVRDFLLELRQFLNNHPQFEIKVDAKLWPDGAVAVFTYLFSVLPKKKRKGNVNVPPRVGKFSQAPSEE